MQALRSGFVAALLAMPGVTVLSPADGATGTGLITVRVAGWACEDLQLRLWERQRMVTNIIREFDAVRFSIAFFTTEAELVTTLDELRMAIHSRAAKLILDNLPQSC